MKLIGIGGISRSGKTILANKLKQQLERKGLHVTVLHQDSYTQPLDTIPKVGDQVDWECPESLDFEGFYDAILQSKEYDVVIVEGFLLYLDPRITQLISVKINLEITKKEFFARKKQDNRWGKIPIWYFEHIWNSFQKNSKNMNLQNCIFLHSSPSLDYTSVLEAIDFD
ncbi:MAG: hypothetical protein ACRCVT_05135 [Leadbetterella sp.]